MTPITVVNVFACIFNSSQLFEIRTISLIQIEITLWSFGTTDAQDIEDDEEKVSFGRWRMENGGWRSCGFVWNISNKKRFSNWFIGYQIWMVAHHPKTLAQHKTMTIIHGVENRYSNNSNGMYVYVRYPSALTRLYLLWKHIIPFVLHSQPWNRSLSILTCTKRIAFCSCIQRWIDFL